MEHAAEVEKRTYRESLQNHRDQILLSKQLATIHTDVPVPFELESWKAQEPDKVRLRELYKTLEFNRLLREMGDAEPAADEGVVRREYRQLQSREELDAWLAAVPADAPVAVAVGEMMSETVVGLAARVGEACSVALGDAIPERATVAHDIKALGAAIRRVSEPDARRDAVRISAIGGSGGVRSGISGGEALGACGGFGPGGGSRCGAGDLPKAAAGSGGGGFGGCVREDRSAADSRAGGDGIDRASEWIRRSSAC